MPAIAEMLTVGEAAVVAGVETRIVNDALDREVLPSGFWTSTHGRRLTPESCALVAFYDVTQDRLTRDERLRVIHEITSVIVSVQGASEASARWRSFGCWSGRLRRLLERPLVVWSADRSTSVDFSVFVERTTKAAEDLERAVAMVTEDPEVMGGQPCIRDTRIPVHDIAASVRADIPIEEILEGYPDLTADDVRLTSLYARAHPPRGRPRRAAEAWPDATVSFRASRPRRPTA